MQFDMTVEEDREGGKSFRDSKEEGKLLSIRDFEIML